MSGADPITAVSNLVTGVIDKFWLDAKDKEDLKLKATMFVATEARAADSEFRNFVVQYEGALKDYINFPIVGPLVALLRGIIRPGFTILVGYLDYVYIRTGVSFTDEQGSLLWLINLIVLVFWFGERVVQNTGLLDFFMKKAGVK